MVARFGGFDGWPEGPDNVDLRVRDRLFDLHNNADLQAVCHRPADAVLEFSFTYNLDWQRLGGPDDQQVILRFVGVRRLRMTQEDDADGRAGRDFDGVTYGDHEEAAQFTVHAAASDWSFAADRVEFVL